MSVSDFPVDVSSLAQYNTVEEIGRLGAVLARLAEART